MADTQIVGLAEIESEIWRLVGKLEDVTKAVRQRGEAAAYADTTYDIAYSQAFLLAKEGKLAGQEARASDQAAKAHAVVVASKELTDRNISQALYESSREAARNIRSQLDALRSINTNTRALTVAS